MKAPAEYDNEMAEFASLDSYLHFQKDVRWKTCYVYGDETEEFLKTVIATSASRARKMKSGQILFRAQRGYTWRPEGGGAFEVETAFDPERMMPKAELVGEGRVNPSKIPCLYLATNRNTAMAEVRPWIGSRISLAEFKVMQDCRMVDCSLDRKRSIDFMLFRINARKKLADPDAATKEGSRWPLSFLTDLILLNFGLRQIARPIEKRSSSEWGKGRWPLR